MSSSCSELIDNSSDEVSSCIEMENVLLAWANVNDLSNACVSVAEASVSSPDDSCNFINKKLTASKRNTFPPRMQCQRDQGSNVLSAITNSSAPAEEACCIRIKKCGSILKTQAIVENTSYCLLAKRCPYMAFFKQ